jgi:hypothetical protein
MTPHLLRRSSRGRSPSDFLKGRADLPKVEDFVDLAGSVKVSPEKKGAAWPAIKASTWRRRATDRK